MVRGPTPGQQLGGGALLGALLIGLAYATWAVLGDPSSSTGLTHAGVIAGAVVVGFAISVGLQNAGHARTVRRFEGKDDAAMEASVLVSGLRGETVVERVHAISCVTSASLEAPPICDAMLELATDTRAAEQPGDGTGQTVSQLAQARLIELAPSSPSWTRAVDLRLAIDPGLAGWLAAIGRSA